MRRWIIGSTLVLIALVVSFVLSHLHQNLEWLHITVVAFTSYGVLLLAAAVVAKAPPPIKNDTYRPFVSCMIPARNEAFVIEATVRSLAAMHYRKGGKPNFEIVVMDDCSTDATWDILQRLRQEIPNLVAVRRSPEEAGCGKSAVLNHGLQHCQGEIIGIFDADTRVEEDFLKKTVPYLYDPRIGGVQGRVRIYNADHNYLTAVQEDEFAVMAHLTQIAKDIVGGLTALGGNGQLTRRSVLDELGGWNHLSTTEDLDLSLQMVHKGYEIRYCGDAQLWQEGVTTWSALLRQRARWAEGFIKCLFDYGLGVLTAPLSFVRKLDGFVSLARILIPMWVWIGYAMLGSMAWNGLHPTHESNVAYAVSSYALFIVMLLGMKQAGECSWISAVGRVARYWIYNFVWLVVVPMGFVNTLRNLNSVTWDKTAHLGDEVVVEEELEDVPVQTARTTEASVLTAQK